MVGKVRVGIIGLGAISFAHEAGYNDNGQSSEIVAFCDINQEELSNRIPMYPDAHFYNRYQDLLADTQIDMVDIIVPHQYHFEIAKAALEANKHVFVEKPITVEYSQGMELISLARNKKMKFGVAENTPFVTAYIKAEEILKQDLLGKIESIRSLIAGSEVGRIKDPNLWHGKKPYGGVILDSAVHSIYLYKWLFGGIQDVRGFAFKRVPEGEVEDNGLVLGHLHNGADFQMNVSCTFEIPWTERLEIYGSKGGMIIDQLSNPVVKYYLGSGDIDGTEVEDVPFDPLAWKYNSILAEVRDFVASIIEDRPSRVDPDDALYALKIVNAITSSIQSNQSILCDKQ